jgi:hypothetical protein
MEVFKLESGKLADGMDGEIKWGEPGILDRNWI